ncbi:Origin recognition complex subunit 2 [Micractinium conductrix]|uniref:Origin recognition complex subunit 2 n=1 Tax=Micractinium conductrix TaxID=554055 RepID=A0A2P6V7B4_9CHLO|nr:Origin recognition complex subunit 2 [Micractinium conductrix]|eukprot:PSC69977.1 Origin recognition complex subunit 2 [Micractinium conductrix]
MSRKRRSKMLPLEDEEPVERGSESEDADGAPAAKRQRGGRRGGGGGRARAFKAATDLTSTYFQGQDVGAGSGRTLADLAIDVGTQEEGVRSLLASLPERHAPQKAALRKRQHAQFGRWWAQLAAGHSLLLYGFGSKYELLQQFAQEQLGRGDAACLAVNGLQPGLAAKQIMQHAVAAVKQSKAAHYRGCILDDLLSLLRSDERHLYLVLHNIDGPGLRDHSAQRALSQLAALPTVHLAASVDHANAAALWDTQTRDRFSWVWHNVTNYAPYLREVGYAAIPSMLVGRSEQCSKESATVVLASLSASAREVFKLVAHAQLDPEGEKGIPFGRLFQVCRERFLVSNEMLLKSFLTEFKDHELLVTKRAADGAADLLHVPLAEDVLQQVLVDVDAMG